MPAAIRIDKTEVLHGKRHIELLFDYRNREGLTDAQVDAMFEAGRIEFGSVWIHFPKHMQEGVTEWKWSGDETRDSVYKSIDTMIAINGRPRDRD